MQSPPAASRSRSTESQPSEWEKGEVKGKEKGPTILLTQSAPVPIDPKKSVLKSAPKGKESQLMTSGRLRKREQKLLANNRFGELMGAWGIPEEEELIKAFDVAYRKPLNAHGSLYIFSKYLCFANRNKNIKWAVQLSDIQKIEVKKGHHSPKTFVFLHLGDGSSYDMHKFRGRTGRSRNEMVATVLLAWEHARGNKSIDLALLRAAGTYALKHPLLKQLLEQHETTPDEEEEDEEERSDNDSNNAVPSIPAEVDEFWDQFGPPVLPPDQNNELPDALVACRPANLAQADRETTFPVSVAKMWLLLFSDSSTLVADYQQKNGAFELHSTKWEDKGNYFERTYGFSKPIQSRLMSGTCVVVQEQKACLLSSGTLLHFGASAMTGVPKGDCFKLKSMYEITDAGDGTTKIRYWAWVDWHKGGGILKGPIGSGTARAALDSFGTQMEYIRNKLPTAKAYVATSGSNQATPSSSLSSSATNIAISSSVPTDSPVPASLTINKPNTGGFGSLSLVETLLLVLVIFFLLTTLYYRWSASSLSAMVEELKAAQGTVKGLP